MEPVALNNTNHTNLFLIILHYADTNDSNLYAFLVLISNTNNLFFLVYQENHTEFYFTCQNHRISLPPITYTGVNIS